MPLRVNNNIPSLNVQRLGKINNRELQMRLERLFSGLLVNRAADDAAGLQHFGRNASGNQRSSNRRQEYTSGDQPDSNRGGGA